MKQIILFFILSTLIFAQVDSVSSRVQAPSDLDVDTLHWYFDTSNPPTTLIHTIVDVEPSEIDTFGNRPAAIGTYYSIWKAVDDSGNVSVASNQLSVVVADPIPEPPASFLAIGGTSETEVVSTWVDDDDVNLDSVRVYRSPDADTSNMVWLASVGTGVQTYTFTGLTAATAYWFATKSLDGSGQFSEFCTPDSGTTIAGGAANAPTSITGTDHTNLELIITAVGGITEDSLIIYGGTSTESTTALDTIAYADLPFTYSSITEEAFWYVRAKQGASGTWSDYSIEDTVTIDSTNILSLAESEFTTDGTGSYGGYHATISWETTFMRSTQSDGGNATGIYGGGVLIGLNYYITVDAQASNSTNVVKVSTGGGSDWTLDGGSLTTSWKTFTGVVTAEDNQFYITTNTDDTIGWTFDLDNIKVQRTPETP